MGGRAWHGMVGDRLQIPDIVRLVSFAGFVATGSALLGALWAFGEQEPLLGAGAIMLAMWILISTLLFTAIYQAIRDHGNHLASRLEAIAGHLGGDGNPTPADGAEAPTGDVWRTACPACDTAQSFGLKDLLQCSYCGHADFSVAD